VTESLGTLFLCGADESSLMTIAKRLVLLLSVPLLALVGLGVFTLWQLTTIETPSRFVAALQIPSLATLGNISRAFAELRVQLRNHVLATSDAERTKVRSAFERDEAELGRLLDEYERRLISDERDRRLLNDYRAQYRDWLYRGKQVMSLAAEGRRDEAGALLGDPTTREMGERLNNALGEWIRVNEELAYSASRTVVESINASRWRILAANVAAILLTILLGFVTFLRIVKPIRALDASVKAIAAGEYDKEVPFTRSTDETGGLARSVDVLKQGAAAMEDQRWVKANVSKVTRALQGIASLADFGQRLLSDVVPMLGGGAAGFYVLNEGASDLQRVATYGMTEGSGIPTVIRLGEGLVGQCAHERRTLALANLPPGYLRIASGLGHAAPVQATAMPSMSGNMLLGVLEVASFQPLIAREKALLDELLPVVAMSLEVLQRNLSTQELLVHTQAQARELAEQTEELTRAETELRKQSGELQRAHFMADGALELTQSGHWHVPLDGSGWYNSSERAARIFGDVPNADHRYTVEHWAEHVRLGDEEAAKATLENFTAAIEGRVPAYNSIYAYKRPVDGRVVWIHALGKVVKDDNGKPTDMFGVTQDISEFKLLENELVQAKRKAEEATEMKSMFLANMSHEIRTPMNAIIGLSHLALRTALSPKQRDYVSKIHNAGTSLLAVINDILDFSKIEAGRLDIEATDFRLDDVISSVTTLTAQKAYDKGLEFLAHVAPRIPEHLLGDPLRLGQILTNLVNNAVKFTEQGEIRLNIELVERTGEKVQLKCSVRDTGIGMTPEQSARLFQPFTQADMSTTRKHGGTGLGLTISRRLVELMGGRIWLESEAGAGTTFFFTVWLGVGAATGSGRIVPEKLGRLRVLIVDDNAAAREILQEPLSAVASRVDAVASGKDAIAAIQERDATDPYDIVFMDWRMPGMDGLQASRHIKHDETLSHRPAIVLVTAFGREEVREEAERLQLDGFLLKPVTRSMIVDTLVNVFSEGGEDLRGAADVEQASRLRGARILLTEDNEINQQIAVELLESAGATVTVANNGREAVEMLSGPGQPPYDIVLMDLQMPEMDGYQATARLRADSRLAALPIIAMTAHATVEERQRCLAAGMNDHVAKPIDPAVLFETVARFYKPAEDAPAPDRPASATPVEALPSIAGLDTSDGLARVGGNRKLYVKILRQFADQQGPAIDQVADGLASGDLALAERLAHTLKGVAGNIGATEVQSFAALLERAIRDRAPGDEIERARQRVGAVLGPLTTGIGAALAGAGSEESTPAQPVTPASPAQSRQAAVQLAALLSDSDPSAGEFVDANRDPLRALFDAASWPEFEALVQGYNFAEAQARLEHVLDTSARSH
jgi:two-component system, sensor histidine kinase and response regulator